MRIVSIVVTYNGAPWITQCLSSLLNSTVESVIIVIDNASTDNCKQLVRAFPQVELVELEQNIGFGAANNIGLRRALSLQADYVLLLNQDAWVAVDTIEQLVRIAATTPKVGILSPLHWSVDGLRLDPNFQSNLVRDNHELINKLLRNEATQSHVSCVPFVNAAIWLLSRNCLERIGGFDPLFFMYGEDYDYCQRVSWHGLKIGVAVTVSAYHARGTAFQRGSFLQELRRQAMLPTAWLILIQKNLYRPLYRRLLSAVYFMAKSSFEVLAQGKIVAFFALWMALFQTSSKLMKIYEHREKSKRVGSHWLAP
jgi:GT2 family glycosyltransferase